MRTLIDIPHDQIVQLNRLAEAEKVSRAALVREAITKLLTARGQASGDAIAASFGLWAGMEEDGVAYQERLRSEW